MLQTLSHLQLSIQRRSHHVARADMPNLDRFHVIIRSVLGLDYGWWSCIRYCVRWLYLGVVLYGIIVFDAFMLVLSIAIATLTVYASLICVFYLRDRAHPRRAPASRLRFFAFHTLDECPICRGSLQDPILLSCGHIYCAECLVHLIETAKAPRPCCPRAPTGANSLRLERVATMQLALDMAQSIEFLMQVHNFGWRRAMESSVGATAVMLIMFFDLIVGPYHGLPWWRRMQGFSTDRYARHRRRREQEPDLRWVEDVLDQCEDGWNWYGLMWSGFIVMSR